MTLPPRGYLTMPRHYRFIVTTKVIPLASIGSSPGMLPTISPCTAQPPLTKNYLVQNINSAKIGKLCCRQQFSLEFVGHLSATSRIITDQAIATCQTHCPVILIPPKPPTDPFLLSLFFSLVSLLMMKLMPREGQ